MPNTTLTLTKSSIKMFIRNKQSLFFTLFLPVMIMAIFGLIGFDRAQKMDIGLVVGNPSKSTQQFIDNIKQVTAFDINTGDLETEKQALKDDKRAIVMQIPDNLIPDPSSKNPPSKQVITVYKNISQEQQAQAAISIISQFLDKTTLTITKAPALFELKTETINSKNVRYIDFLLPGIIAMAVMQMAVFSVAFVFADYKEKGILKRLLATPLKPFQFVTANVITRLMVAIAQTAILIIMGILIYKTHVYGSYPLVLLISILGGIMFLGLGFIISGIAKTVESVPALANLLVFPMMFLSGIFFPINSMPGWLQSIVQYFPLTHFAHALREVMANGAGFSLIAKDVYWMLGWSIVLIVLANFTFGFEEKRV
ncbi:MAG: ABC transporter permease [Patescibacteria group bacterium]|jgi:ABC-2 type transport system permease protein